MYYCFHLYHLNFIKKNKSDINHIRINSMIWHLQHQINIHFISYLYCVVKCCFLMVNRVKYPDAGKDLKAGGEGSDRGWDDWMALPTQWTWVWASSWRWWRSRKLGMLQSMGLQRVGHYWVTEQQHVSCTTTLFVFIF